MDGETSVVPGAEGALGKGRLIDRVAELIPGPAVVDASGDLRVCGMPQRVALEHPHGEQLLRGLGPERGGELLGEDGVA